MKTEKELTESGFTESGRNRYIAVLQGYEGDLHAKAIRYGEINRAEGMPREVTHEHVRAAAHSIASSYGTTTKSWLSVTLQLLEYVFTLLAGIGGGNLSQSWGVALFIGAAALGVIAFVIRNINLKS